jgi:hypothetical protein
LINIETKAQLNKPLDSLEMYVVEHHSKVLKADMEEFKKDKKYNYLYFLPSLGYDFMNHKPYITYNVGNLAAFLKSNRGLQLKVNGLIEKSKVSLKSDLIRLRAKFNYCNTLHQRFKDEMSIYRDYEQLYEIAKKSYENGEMTIEEFIKRKIQFKERSRYLKDIENSINLAVIDIELLTNENLKYNLPEY